VRHASRLQRACVRGGGLLARSSQDELGAGIEVAHLDGSFQLLRKRPDDPQAKPRRGVQLEIRRKPPALSRTDSSIMSTTRVFNPITRGVTRSVHVRPVRRSRRGYVTKSADMTPER
jgi:hypothetical protein